MAIAGKVAITPGYEWSVDVAYDKLVVVTFGNNVYLSTKPSTGIEPTNEEYWMLLIENVTAEDLAELQTTVDNILNGTTSVGDSLKLGGKGASEYMELAKYQPISKGMLNTSIKELAVTLDKGVYDISFGGNSYTGNDLPKGSGNVNYNFATATIFVRASNSITIYLWGRDSRSPLARSYYGGSSWTEWEVFATTADLANYLPLSAKPTGTYTGNGSATARTINTGGTGNWIAIYGASYMILVSVDGAIYHAKNSESVQALPTTKINFINGNLTIASDSEVVNSNGRTYTYQVL